MFPWSSEFLTLQENYIQLFSDFLNFRPILNFSSWPGSTFSWEQGEQEENFISVQHCICSLTAPAFTCFAFLPVTIWWAVCSYSRPIPLLVYWLYPHPFISLEDILPETLLSFANISIFPLYAELFLSAYKHAITFPLYLRDFLDATFPLAIDPFFFIHTAKVTERSGFTVFSKTKQGPLWMRIPLTPHLKLSTFPPFILFSFFFYFF